MVKLKSSEKLRRWRIAHEESYARAVMEPPRRTSLYSAIPKQGLLLIMGDIRTGKSVLGHEIANQLHNRRGMAAALHLPAVSEKFRKEVQRLVPKWMMVATDRSDWPKNAVIIYDETSQSAHARRSQSNDAVDLDNLMGISGQRGQLIVFITHHSRKIDINTLRGMPVIIWKEPITAHAIFEREEFQDFVWRAIEFYRGITGQKKKLRSCFCLDYRNMETLCFTNSTPPWWCDELSRLFAAIKAMNGSLLDKARGGDKGKHIKARRNGNLVKARR